MISEIFNIPETDANLAAVQTIAHAPATSVTCVSFNINTLF